MKNRLKLYQLVHKLNKGEKRAFKIYIKKYKTEKDQRVAQLFDLFNKMPEYNEEMLLDVFTKGQLTYNLHRLKNFLLAALSDLHFKKNNESIGEIINRIELGFKYGDSTIIEDNLKKGFEVTEQTNNVALKVCLLKYQQALNFKRKDLERFIETDKQIIKETNSLNSEAHYELLWGEVSNWSMKSIHKRKVLPIQFSNQKLTEIFNAPLNNMASFYEQGRYLGAKRLYIEVLEKHSQTAHKKGLAIYEQLCALYSNNNVPIPLPYTYGLVFNHLLLHNVEEAEKILNQYELLNNYKNFDFNGSDIPFIKLTLVMMYYLYKEDFKHFIEFEDIVEDLLRKATTHLYNVGTDLSEQLLYPLIIAFFKMSAYDKCLNWILKTKTKEFDKEQTKFKSIAFSVFQFIELFCHFELENTQILSSLINSLQYTINVKNSNFTKEEQELIRIAKNIVAQKKFVINTNAFEQIQPFSYYKVFFPYLEVKQKEFKKPLYLN